MQWVIEQVCAKFIHNIFIFNLEFYAFVRIKELPLIHRYVCTYGSPTWPFISPVFQSLASGAESVPKR